MGVKKSRKTVAQVSEETLRIEGFLRTCKVGDVLSYDMIERKSGVPMTYKGKQYLRTALKRIRMEYSPIIGHGIRLASPETAMPLVIRRLDKIDRSVKRAEKTQKNLQEQFFEQLSPSEQNQLLFVGAAFGAIRVAAENGKLLYQSRKKMSTAMEIPMPIYK